MLGQILSTGRACGRTSMVILAFAATTLAQAPVSLPTRHVPRAVADGQAEFVREMPPSQMLNIDLLLPARDPAALDLFLQQLHDPSSPNYLHFLNVQQFTSRFAPTAQTYSAVAVFLQLSGFAITKIVPDRLLLEASGTVADIDRIFHIRMGVYRDPTEDRTFFAPDREPTITANLPLWHIGGLDNYSIPRPLYRQAAAGVKSDATGSGPGGDFLGSDRRAAYYGGSTLTGSGQSVALFELDGYNMSDVSAYFSNVNQPLNVGINNVLVDGASAGSDGNDTEQAADIEEAASMAPALSQVRVYIGPRATFQAGKTDADIFSTIDNENIAQQVSVSWGWEPTDYSTDDPIFKAMLSKGQNIFVASGDNGSFPNGSGEYYPAEDANVVAVGGTTLTTIGAGGSWASETAWATSNNLCGAGYSSGGGISPDHIPIPSYQQRAGIINASNGGSATYRDVPDVAAEANCDNYFCANGGCGTVGGTSLAAPTWAGYMALANQQAAQNGQGRIGFINPEIYPIGISSSYSVNFHDITAGSNGAFSAVAGYDLVTGWGSPNGAMLINSLGAKGSASASPTSLSFTSYYDQNVTETDTLTNNGPGTLAMYSITTNGAYFGVSTSCGNYLASGSSCSTQVTFSPGGCVPTQYATLTYSDNGSGGGTQNVSLTGKTLRCTTTPQQAPKKAKAK